MAEEGEESAALGVVALHLTVCSRCGVSGVNEIGGGGTAVGVAEPARGARHRLFGHLAHCQSQFVHVYECNCGIEGKCALTNCNDERFDAMIRLV